MLRVKNLPKTLFKRLIDPEYDDNSPITTGRAQKMHLFAKKWKILIKNSQAGFHQLSH
jgi:hypothetical protein